jgi:threonine/homoserine/homoserine lactone efflux protein
MIAYLMQGIAYGFAAAVQPGPLQTYVIAQTLRNGWRKTIIYCLVPLLSDLPIIALVLLILSQVPPAFILVIRFGGGIFLLYLAVSILRMAKALREEEQADSTDTGVGLFKAVAVNFLNPLPYIYWGSICGPTLVIGWRESPAFGIALIAGFYATMILIMAAIIIVVSQTRHLPIIFQRILLIASAIGLTYFSLRQLLAGLQALLEGSVG